MKVRTLIILIILSILGLIFLYPYYEIFVATIFLILFLSYLHYMKHKPYLGPYIHFKYDPARTMMINWIGVKNYYKDDKDKCRANISKRPDFGDEIARKDYYCTSLKRNFGRYYYHILVDDLEPSTLYYYRIFWKDKVLFGGPKYHFKTGPPSESGVNSDGVLNDNGRKNENMPGNEKGTSENTLNKAKFIIYGDDQTADFIPIFAQWVNNAQYKDQPDFIIHLGDINQDLWRLHTNNVFFITKKKLFRNIPYMPVIGNHDTKPISQYFAFYDIDPWYAFEYTPKLRFIIISGFHGFEPNTSGQYEFIKEQLELASKKEQFAIICSHHEIYHIQHKRVPEVQNVQLKKYILPLLKKYNKGLQRNILWFNGHQHDYCRVIKDDLTFITTGTTSNAKWYSKLKDNKEDTFIPEIAEIEYGGRAYCLLTTENDGNTLRLTVKTPKNKIIEELIFNL